jgi:hypothetical protein
MGFTWWLILQGQSGGCYVLSCIAAAAILVSAAFQLFR